MTAEVIGYARVSTEDQNLDLQRDVLASFERGEERPSTARMSDAVEATSIETAEAEYMTEPVNDYETAGVSD